MNAKIVVSVVAFVALTLGVAISTTQSAQAGPNDKVAICHANNGNGTGGFVSNEPNASAVDGQGGQGDHNQSGHQNGRDIIPPFYRDGTPGYWTPRNWDAVGMATFYNGCNTPKVATAAVSTIAATCETGEKLVYGAITNATFSGTANSTTGPAPYSVTATANADSLFSGNATTRAFNGTLNGPIPAQSTNPDAPCYEAPEPDMASAEVSTEAATCDLGEKLVYGEISNATFSGTANGTAGPGSYDVTATANPGAAFEDMTDTKNFTGTLGDKLPVQHTDPEAACYEAPGRGGETPKTPETPVTPAAATAPAIDQLPNTAAPTTPIVVSAAAAFAGVLLAIAHAVKARILARI